MRRVACLLAALGVACVPSFEDRPWLIEETRVLAIGSEPAEARPNEGVSLSALVAGPMGPSNTAPQWSVCTRPRTSGERSAVTQSCLEGETLMPTSASTNLLPDACARFGPNPPPVEDGAVPQRPSDPDPSGGYFVPVFAEAVDASAFGAIRVRCDLPSVTRATFEEFEERYVANTAPQIEALYANGLPAAQPIRVRAGETIDWLVDVEGASESYVRYDARSGEIVAEREWLRIAWFVTAGDLERGGELHEGDALERPFEVSWVAPLDAQQVHAWAVLTDARGGVAWRSMELEVE